MSFLRYFAETNFTQIISNIIQLITSVIITRELGRAGKGAYSASYALMEIVVYLFIFGVGQSILYAGSKFKEKTPRVAFHAALFSFFFGSLAGLTLVILASTNTPLTRNLKDEYVLVIAPLAVMSIFFSNFSYLLISQQRYRMNNFLNLMSASSQLLFLLILVFLNSLTIYTGLLVLNISSGLALLIQLVYVYREFGFIPKIDPELIKTMFRVSYKAYFITLMNYIILRSDLVLLNSIKGNADTGIYSISAALAGKMLLFSSPVYYILSPRVISSPKENLSLQAKVARNLVFFMTSLLIIADLLYAPAVRILYGSQFVISWQPFLILNIGILFLSTTNALSPYFVSKGYPPISILTPLIAAATNVILNLLLIPFWSYNAAALTSSISYLIYYLVFAGYISKNEGIALKDFLIPRRYEVVELINRIFGSLKSILKK
jgi:O-antigen/teichoic acid export membrane protein